PRSMTSIAEWLSTQRGLAFGTPQVLLASTRILEDGVTQIGCGTAHGFWQWVGAGSAGLSDGGCLWEEGRTIMTMPVITACYLGVLGLLYAFLGLRVARKRRGHSCAASRSPSCRG